jgi:hypothetical protein
MVESSRSAHAVKLTNRKEEFLFRNPQHQCEYLVPIGFGAKNSGALVVAFADAAAATDIERSLIDAAARQAALAAQVSRLIPQGSGIGSDAG